MIDLVSSDCKLRIVTETAERVTTKVTQNGIYVSNGYALLYKGTGNDNHISRNLRSLRLRMCVALYRHKIDCIAKFNFITNEKKSVEFN